MSWNQHLTTKHVARRLTGRRIAARRIAAAALAAILLSTALTACIGKAVRSTEDWLAGQPHVLSVGVPSSTVDELSYRATLRAELDPAATDAEIEALIDSALDFVATQPGDDVQLQFGMHDIDFEVADKSGARTALALWHRVVGIPNIVSGFVAPDSVAVETLRATAFEVFDALAPLGVSRAVQAYHAASDFDLNSVDFQPPLGLSAASDCTADPNALSLAQAAMTDDRVNFGTLDLCEGFDVTFLFGYPIADGVAQVRSQLDAVGLSDFPVTIALSPEVYGSANYHIVAVTPGSADALAVVPALEASGLALRYELAADRTLTLESSEATATQLLGALSASGATASLGQVTITGSDTTVTGAVGDLAALIAAAVG